MKKTLGEFTKRVQPYEHGTFYTKISNANVTSDTNVTSDLNISNINT
jgi:hypothetical protein